MGPLSFLAGIDLNFHVWTENARDHVFFPLCTAFSLTHSVTLCLFIQLACHETVEFCARQLLNLAPGDCVR